MKQESAEAIWIALFDDEMRELVAEWDQARRRWDQSRPEGALDDMGAIAQLMLERQPGNAIAWRCLARTLSLAGRAEDAREAWEHILATIDPHYDAALFALGRGKTPYRRRRNRELPSVYESHCWKCQNAVSSVKDRNCADCHFWECGACGACFCGASFLWSRARVG